MTLETMSTYILRITLGLPKPDGMTDEETATWNKVASGGAPSGIAPPRRCRHLGDCHAHLAPHFAVGAWPGEW